MRVCSTSEVQQGGPVHLQGEHKAGLFSAEAMSGCTEQTQPGRTFLHQFYSGHGQIQQLPLTHASGRTGHVIISMLPLAGTLLFVGDDHRSMSK